MGHVTHNLAALIGSRICHDLISPIGAITNGLELMQMSGSTLTPEVALVTESVGNANARIRFFRVAYGLASTKQSMGRPEIISILKDGAVGARVSVDWGPLDPVPRDEVRLVFLALQCFETAMPFGGQITVTREAGQWELTGAADRMRQMPDLWASLQAPDAITEITPAQVQFALLPSLLADEARQISLRLTEADIVMRF
ncbi:MAG: histidine phosphotransferase family protein [Rhodobacterales bacterium]